MATAKPNILQRINAVMKDVKYIQKTANVNAGGKYKAVTHDEVTKKLHPAMQKHGIVALLQLVEDSMAPSGMITSNSNPIFLYQCVYDVVFCNIDEKDDTVTCRVSAHANDTSDKAPGKAASYAMKYALLKTFLLETGDEEEERVEGNAAPISEEQVIELENLCTEFGFPPEETLKALATKVYKLEDISQLPHTGFDNAVKRLKKKAADAKRNSGNKGQEKPAKEKPAQKPRDDADINI